MIVSQEFYNQWYQWAIDRRPHQTPPTKEQFELLLDILTSEYVEIVLHQFD